MPNQTNTAQPGNIIQNIANMDLAALRTLWSKHFRDPPPLRSCELMRLMLAWRLQAREHGGIDKATRLKLKRMKLIAAEGLELGAGTRLTREWQGHSYEIMVAEDGFLWEDDLYPSLSAVARAITGTRWNGPRFFGLRKGG